MNLFPWKHDAGKTVVTATKPKVDPRVGHCLDLASLAYEVEENGTYRVNWHLGDDGHTQAAIIDSRVMTFNGWEWRKVYSFAFHVTGPLSQEQANELLSDADHHAFGGWCLSRQGDVTSALYQVSIDSDVLSFELKEAVALVCTVADAMKRKVQ